MNNNAGKKVDLPELFKLIERTLSTQLEEAGFINHSGDMGENREDILRNFLQLHLPDRYGVTKGEILTKDGIRSHSADIIIYDKIDCPILYSGKTSIVPMEGVYGIIEVKSKLSKKELVDSGKKIATFKSLAPRDLAVISTREYVTVSRPSRPFGIVVGCALDGNSLQSLNGNLRQLCDEIHDVNFFINLVLVINTGLLWWEHVNLSIGEKNHLLDTDKFVDIVLRSKEQPQVDDVLLRIVSEVPEGSSFGRFFVYLLIVLRSMKLNPPDLAAYIDPDLGTTISRES